MTPYNLTTPQLESVAWLVRLGSQALTALGVPFTRHFLAETVQRAYVRATRAPAPTGREGSDVDWNDATNLVVVLLEALRAYHVKHEIVDEPPVAEGAATLAILAPASGDEPFSALAGVVHGADGERVQVGLGDEARPRDYPADRVEAFVVLRRSRFTEEPKFKTNLQQQRVRTALRTGGPIAAAAVLGIAALGRPGVVSPLLWAPLLLVWAGGLYVCYSLFLVDKANDYSTPLVQRLCANGRDAFSCKTVLSSRGAKIFGVISLTDVGAIYFTTLAVSALLGLLTRTYSGTLAVLFWCSVAPVPYTLYLLYQQAAVLKRLCLLCMTVHALLLVQFGYFLLIRSRIEIFRLEPRVFGVFVLVAAFATLLYVLGSRWSWLTYERTLFVGEREVVKSDREYFEVLVRREREYDNVALPGALQLGVADAPLRLSGILSPACGACGAKLAELARIADWFDGHVGVTILIKADEVTEDMAKTLLGYTLGGRHADAEAFLMTWYGLVEDETAAGRRIDIDQLLAVARSRHSPTAAGSEAVRAAHAAHTAWFSSNPVPHTPMVLFDGRALPQMYRDLDTLAGIVEQYQGEGV